MERSDTNHLKSNDLDLGPEAPGMTENVEMFADTETALEETNVTVTSIVEVLVRGP